MDHEHAACRCACHKANGFLLTLIGLVILLAHLAIISEQLAGIIWPSLLIAMGLKNSLVKGRCKCCNKA